MTIDRNTILTAALVALAPAGAIIGARHIGSGAGGAIGAQIAEPRPLPVFEPVNHETPDPERFADLRSPFPAVQGTGFTVVEPELFPRPSDEPAETLPDFTLTAVMPHPTRPLAVINGRARAIGDQPQPGWTLTEIHGDARQIVLTGPSGRTVRVGMGALRTRP